MSSNLSARGTADFGGPFLKIERAQHHINDLETRFENYVKNNMKRLRPERQHRALKSGRTLKPISFDKHIPTILGDALHNLRAALDYSYHIAAEANSAPWNDWRKFPFGQDRLSLDGSINGHKGKGIAPSAAVCDAIVNRIQPYEGGCLGLYGLHRLDITDKHLVLIPTVSAMHIEKLEFRNASGAKTGSRIEGITLVFDQSKGGEFIGTGPGGAILHGNPQDTFKILFGKGQPFADEPILEVLRSLAKATVEAVEIIRDEI